MKTLILILLFIPLMVMAITNINDGKFWNPPDDVYYFGTWLDSGWGSITINKETKIVDTCWMIKHSNPYQADECSVYDFSILQANFPHKLIEDLK